jgi:hypothetical protein
LDLILKIPTYEDHDAGEMDECIEMIELTNSTGHHALKFVQSGEQVFGFPPQPIVTEPPVILSPWLDAIAPMRSGQLNALLSDLLDHRPSVVGTIPEKSLCSSQEGGLREGSFDKCDFIWSSRSRCVASGSPEASQ